jgi:hypothetical protein
MGLILHDGMRSSNGCTRTVPSIALSTLAAVRKVRDIKQSTAHHGYGRQHARQSRQFMFRLQNYSMKLDETLD